MPGETVLMQLRFLTLFYFSVLTYVFHLGLVKNLQGDPVKAGQKFIRYYMAATTIKLMIHLIVILAVSLTHKSMAVPFIISFMVMYALFTAFEVYTSMKARAK